MKHGVLFINIGSPASLQTSAVASYLREFLTDKRVIDINWFLRLLLVNLLIVPFRTRRSQRAYRQIWRSPAEGGSPLLFFSHRFAAEIQKKLPSPIVVSIAMRYSKPSISTAISALIDQGIDNLLIFPLFPQYSSAANGSAIEAALACLAKQKEIPRLQVVNCFYDQEFYLQPLTASIGKHLRDEKSDFLLFSYHGLPERQLPCQQVKGCCAQPSVNNRLCYRFHCQQTSQAVAQRLQLSKDFYATSFQSRLGRIPWIKPYSDEKIKDLARQGVKNLAVVCPSFVADCLETLEEVGMQLHDDFIRYGGQKLTLIPCLNYTEQWVESCSSYLRMVLLGDEGQIVKQ